MNTPLKQIDRATDKRMEKVKSRLMSAVRTELQRGDVSSDQLLALMAHVTGSCIAYQDQTKMTVQQAFDLVVANIEAGNREAIEMLLSASGPMQ